MNHSLVHITETIAHSHVNCEQAECISIYQTIRIFTLLKERNLLNEQVLNFLLGVGQNITPITEALLTLEKYELLNEKTLAVVIKHHTSI